MTRGAGGKAPASPASGAKTVPTLGGGAIQRGLVAGFLAWVFPGAGHWYVGKKARAAVFCVLVLGSTALGAIFDGNLSVIDSRTPWLSKLQVASNLALGPLDPALRLTFYGALVYRGDDGTLPREIGGEQALKRRLQRTFRTWSSYGSAYLMAAGLMNLLLIFDAWDIAIGRKE